MDSVGEGKVTLNDFSVMRGIVGLTTGIGVVVVDEAFVVAAIVVVDVETFVVVVGAEVVFV